MRSNSSLFRIEGTLDEFATFASSEVGGAGEVLPPEPAAAGGGGGGLDDPGRLEPPEGGGGLFPEGLDGADMMPEIQGGMIRDWL